VLGTGLFKLNGLSLTNDMAEVKENKAPATTPAKTPTRGMRKLTGRQWDLMDESELEAYGDY